MTMTMLAKMRLMYANVARRIDKNRDRDRAKQREGERERDMPKKVCYNVFGPSGCKNE